MMNRIVGHTTALLRGLGAGTGGDNDDDNNNSGCGARDNADDHEDEHEDKQRTKPENGDNKVMIPRKYLQVTPSRPCSSGTFVITCNDLKEACLWDAFSQDLLWNSSPVEDFVTAYSPASNKLAMRERKRDGGRYNIVYDLHTGAAFQLPRNDFQTPEFTIGLFMNNAGTRLIACHQYVMCVWDLETGVNVYVIPHTTCTLCFTGDDTRILCANGSYTANDIIYVLDAETGFELSTMAVSIAPEGQIIAGSNGQLCGTFSAHHFDVWNINTGECMLRRNTERISHLLFVRNDTSIISFVGYKCYCWDITTNSLIFQIVFPQYVSPIAYCGFSSEKSSFYVLGYANTLVYEYDASSGEEMNHSSKCFVSPEGFYVAQSAVVLL
jgi:hypothetical protein